MTEIPDSVIEAMVNAMMETDLLKETWYDAINKALRAAEAHDPPFKLIARELTPEMITASNCEWDGRMSYRSSSAFKATWDAAPSVGKKTDNG